MKKETKIKGVFLPVFFASLFLLPFVAFAQSADGTTPDVKPEPATTTSAGEVTPTQNSAATPASTVTAPSTVTPSPKPQPQNVASQLPEVLPVAVGTTSEEESGTETILFVVLGGLAVVLGGYAAYAQSVKNKNKEENEDKSRCFDIKSLMDQKLDEVTNLKAKLEEKLKDSGRGVVREALSGTDEGKLLALIETGETEYKSLKSLFTECMAEFDIIEPMKKVFIIHGFQGSPNGGWRPWLMAELEKQDIYSCAISMPDPENPICAEWIAEISRHVERSRDDEVYLVGHSLGVPAILRYLESTDFKIAGAVLVSGPCEKNGNAKIDNFLEKGFDFEKIKLNCPKFTIIHGDNDPKVSIGNAEILSRELEGDLIIIKNGGHLNGSSGWTQLPQCLEALNRMMK